MGNKVQANYQDLADAAKTSLTCAQNTTETTNQLKSYIAELLNSGWSGAGAYAFEQQIATIGASVERLATALNTTNTTITQVAQIFSDAEQQAANLYNRNGANAGTISSGSASLNGFGGGGGGVDAINPAAAVPDWLRAVQRYVQQNPAGFKVASDVIGIIPAKWLLATLGAPETALTSLGAAFALDVAATGLTYLQHSDQEPGLVRGGSIAVTDTVFGELIDHTGVGTIVQKASAIVQLSGDVTVGANDILVRLSNAPQAIKNLNYGMETKAFTDLGNVDVTNLRWEGARLYYDSSQIKDSLMRGDWSGASSNFNQIGTDVGHAFDTTGKFVTSAIQAPSSFARMELGTSVTMVDSLVHSPSIPQPIQNAVDGFANDALKTLSTPLVNGSVSIFGHTFTLQL